MAGDDVLYQIQLDMNKASDELEEEYTHERYEKFEHLENLFRTKGGYSFENEASKILIGLGFTEDELQKDPKILSGGWRMRLELAKLLKKSPEFLILDEPTNHLDLPTITWLETYLKKFKGTVLFVSHDESLLTRLPSRILHLKNGDLTEYYGNYDDFLLQYEAIQSGKVSEIKSLESKIDSASKFVEKFKAKASKAAQARSRMKMIARLQGEASQISVDKADSQINIKIPLTVKSGKDVLILDNCSIGYTKLLMKNISMIVTRGQKIAIVGANGLGKSTLIKSIIGENPFLEGTSKLGHNVKMAYYAQDQSKSIDMNKTALDNLRNSNPSILDSTARRLLGSFLFKGNDVYKQCSVLSGGEKSRLSLACLLVQDANFLLLDEPTNHLDILSTEILGEALMDYEGTVMFVSHNRSFINSVSTHILAFSNKSGVYLVKGNLETLDPKWLL
jgi:ATP-binding cassette subfamily F protein 3